MTTLFLDLETFSETPIKHGTYKYAADAEILLFAYAIDDEPAKVIDLTAKASDVWLISELLLSADTIVAHNSMFDRNVLAANSFTTDRTQWRDTMVKAYCHSLPGSLAMLCDTLNIDADHAKDKDGKKLIQLFCKPLGKNRTLERATRDTHPEEWAKFVEYARLDVEAMRAIDKAMPDWNMKAELKHWHLDQHINDRGFAVDTELVDAALKAISIEKKRLAEETQDMTGGAVDSATRRDALLDFIEDEYGIKFPDLQKSTLERRIADPELPDAVRDLLKNRLQASTTSTSKYQALERSTNGDGRLRGTLQFAGAARTGRWAGRTFQPQNLPRPSLSQVEIDSGIEALKMGCADLLTDNMMELTSSAIRGCIVAPSGKKLVVSDLSNIEGRVQAWLADEEWKIHAFSEFDQGRGPDLYKLAYAKSFGVPHTAVNKDQRQIGKVQELALGYGGGVGAFVTFATAYGINLDHLADDAWDTLPEDEMYKAKSWLDMCKADKKTAPKMSDRAFITCDTLKRMWRNAHSNIAQLWYDIESATKSAIMSPGQTFRAGKLAMRRDGTWLRIRMPSGRYLCYPNVRIEDDTIQYMGMNQYTRKWCYLHTYGGKLFENCIAHGTQVATDRGWVAIQDVSDADLVWDGQSWVRHSGLIYKGCQETIEAYGVEMTPEHKVLTTEGWKDASSSARFDRAEVRLPNGFNLRRDGRTAFTLERSMYVRKYNTDGSERVYQTAEERNSSVVRVHAQKDHRRKTYKALNEPTAGVLRLPVDVGPLQITYTPGVRQLRWAGHKGVRTLAERFSVLLGRYERRLQRRFNPGPDRQFERVQSGELQMDYVPHPSEQSAGQRLYRNAQGPYDSIASFKNLRGEAVDTSLETRQRMGSTPRTNAVYDLMDCGPLQRFVVSDKNGEPLIVHNCSQALSRDILAHNMHIIEAAGYEIVLTVHDEVICEAPDNSNFNHEHLSHLLATNPPWAEGMPLAAGGFEEYRYRKD